MTAWLLIAATMIAQPAQDRPWVWVLYGAEGADRVVLANEIPDTPRLRATLECEPGDGAVLISIFDREGAGPGYVSIRSGDVSATSQAELVREAEAVRLTAPLRMEHPVFAEFLESGILTLNQGENRWSVRIGARHLSLLGEFAAACG